MINNVILVGNVTRDPELRDVGETKKAEIGLAVSRKFTSNGEVKKRTTFVDVEVWGRQAEIVGEYVRKGSLIGVEGELEQDSWEDKETGAKRSKLYIKARPAGIRLFPKTGGDGGDSAPKPSPKEDVKEEPVAAGGEALF